MNRRINLLLTIGLIICFNKMTWGEDAYFLHQFDRVQLSDVYFSEGANFGDFNRDNIADVVYGPYWFQGPDFKSKHEIYTPKPQNRNRYADNFFSWVYDFNGDGWNDIFAVGFPGTPAYVYENPAKKNAAGHWEKHPVFGSVSNESPQFTNIVGDDRPELICSRDGFFGYAVIDWKKPWDEWAFHRVSEKVAPVPFGHGLGVGDVNNDGRKDIIVKNGWFQQPIKLTGQEKWNFHQVAFAPRGGADMFAYDVDGDGDNDVITSLAAHEFGLAWFEQIQENGKAKFQKHLIMGSKPEDNQYGLLFSELHTVNLADMDGDGLKDIVTGKTYWSHHRQSPMWDAGAVVYWFKLVRGKDGIDWVPQKADGESGVGRQVIVGDVNNDELPDIVVGGMKGSHVLLHRRKQVSKEDWEASQPIPRVSIKSGLTPEQAAKNMTAPRGFQVRLAAGEPQVHQPIAFTLDHRGRIWLAEAYTYPRRAPNGQGKDKIIILEDTNGDGSLDSRKVFAEGLNLVSGLEVGFGGVWVGAAPYLMFIPDINGDDKPDGKPQILLDGFGYQDTHETLNAFIWGPDGWLYGCHGVFTHSRVGKPGTVDAEREPMNAAVWRYHPTRHQFEVFARGTSNPWGVDFNDHGDAFITACVIPHLWHVIQGARYQRQGGRHFNQYVFDDIKTIADHSHYVGNIRDHAWWGHEPQAAHDTLQAGGGHAHCGAMIYLGDNWPKNLRNQIFMNNIHGNRVNADVLHRHGSGYVGTHGDDLILANDKWFRGINLKYGPDGSVYLIDWYDENACHRTNPEIWDRTNGRIYNISYGHPETVRVDLAKNSDAELVRLQLHKNEWYVRMSRRLLQERANAGILENETRKSLLDIVDNHPDVTRKLRAIWTLHAIGKLNESDRLALMDHSSEYIRSWAIRLELEDQKVTSAVLDRLTKTAQNDPSAHVRLALASALQRIPLNQRWSIVEALVEHDEDQSDHNLPLMYWYGIEPLVPLDTSRAMDLAHASKIPLLTRYITRRAAIDNQTLPMVIASLNDTSDTRTQRLVLEEILQAFVGRVNIPMPQAWSEVYVKLSRSKDESIRDLADQVAVSLGDRRIFPKMREVLVDGRIELTKRRQAMKILLRGRDPKAAAALQAVLIEPNLRGEAIRALAAYDDPQTPNALLSHYSKMSETDRRDAVATLSSRPKYAISLLKAVEENKIPRTDLHAYNIRQMLRFEGVDFKSLIQRVWGEIRESSEDKQAQIAQHKKLLSKAILNDADLSNGRLLFSKTCATCHTLFDAGDKVGPNLTGSNRANLDYILENILDPSAVLGKDYRMTVIANADGRVIQGLVLNETDSAVTLRTLNDTVVIAKEDIEDRKLSEKSMMPEGLLDTLKKNEVRDLIAYLGSPRQVTLKGPRSEINSRTKRVDDAIEGEKMAIIGKSAGNAGSQKMGGFPADRWSGVDHLFWTGAKPGANLDLKLPVGKSGVYSLEIVLTKARDYGIVQLSLDGKNLGGPIDLFNSPDVITTGVLSFPVTNLTAGDHKLSVKILGTNPKAVKSYMFGLDYVRLLPATSDN